MGGGRGRGRREWEQLGATVMVSWVKGEGALNQVLMAEVRSRAWCEDSETRDSHQALLDGSWDRKGREEKKTGEFTPPIFL